MYATTFGQLLERFGQFFVPTSDHTGREVCKQTERIEDVFKIIIRRKMGIWMKERERESAR